MSFWPCFILTCCHPTCHFQFVSFLRVVIQLVSFFGFLAPWSECAYGIANECQLCCPTSPCHWVNSYFVQMCCHPTCFVFNACLSNFFHSMRVHPTCFIQCVSINACPSNFGHSTCFIRTCCHPTCFSLWFLGSLIRVHLWTCQWMPTVLSNIAIPLSQLVFRPNVLSNIWVEEYTFMK